MNPATFLIVLAAFLAGALAGSTALVGLIMATDGGYE